MTWLWDKVRKSFLNRTLTFSVVPCVSRSSITDHLHSKNTDSCEDTEDHWDRLSPCPFCGHEDSPVLARNQRSCSDPTVSGYSRLPPIEKSNQFLVYRSTITPINSQNPIDQNCKNNKTNILIESKPEYPTRHETREEFLYHSCSIIG